MVAPGIELDRWVAAASHLWLFLDYDGTLADFSPLPGLVEPQPELTELMLQLVANPRFRVMIISGRQLKSIQEIFPIPGIFLAGMYGVEIQTPDEETIRRGEYKNVRPFLDRLRPEWEKLIAGRRDFFLEDKNWSLAMHTRTLESKEAEHIFSAARQAANGSAPENQFRWFGDRRYLEIAPIQAHKGKTVEYLLNNFPLAEVRPVYIGDDVIDQEAFEIVHASEGVNIQVANPASPLQLAGADYLLNSPHEVRQWLKSLLQGG